jgi:hypothetical protein
MVFVKVHRLIQSIQWQAVRLAESVEGPGSVAGRRLCRSGAQDVGVRAKILHSSDNNSSFNS